MPEALEYPETPFTVIDTSMTAPVLQLPLAETSTEVDESLETVTLDGADGVPHSVRDVAYEDVPFEFLALTLKA